MLFFAYVWRHDILFVVIKYEQYQLLLENFAVS